MAQTKVKCGSCGVPASNETDNCNFCGSTIVHALGGMGLLRAGKPALDKAHELEPSNPAVSSEISRLKG